MYDTKENKQLTFPESYTYKYRRKTSDEQKDRAMNFGLQKGIQEHIGGNRFLTICSL